MILHIQAPLQTPLHAPLDTLDTLDAPLDAPLDYCFTASLPVRKYNYTIILNSLCLINDRFGK